VEEVTQLMNECHYRRRRSSVNNVTTIKTPNKSETFTNQEESQQSSSFNLTKEQLI